jgi:hypothetical protein
MRATQLSKVSSSTPAAIRPLLAAEVDWFIELASARGVLDIVGFDAVGLVVVGLDIVAAPPPADELSLEVSIVRSLAQPPTMSPKRVIQMAFLSISTSGKMCAQSTLSEQKKQGGPRRNSVEPALQDQTSRFRIE